MRVRVCVCVCGVEVYSVSGQKVLLKETLPEMLSSKSKVENILQASSLSCNQKESILKFQNIQFA